MKINEKINIKFDKFLWSMIINIFIIIIMMIITESPLIFFLSIVSAGLISYNLNNLLQISKDNQKLILPEQCNTENQTASIDNCYSFINKYLIIIIIIKNNYIEHIGLQYDVLSSQKKIIEILKKKLLAKEVNNIYNEDDFMYLEINHENMFNLLDILNDQNEKVKYNIKITPLLEII